jgi:hypothetical protein
MPNIAAVTCGCCARPCATAVDSAGRELTGLDADRLPIGRFRRHDVRLGGEQLRLAGGEPRFGLRDVGLRHLADVETIPRLAQLLLQHAHVVLLQFENRLVAQQIHVGGRRVEQHRLFDQAQRLARGGDLALGLTRAVGRAQTVVERLRGGDADGTRRGVHPRVGVDGLIRIEDAVALRQRVGELRPRRGGGADRGPVARECLRNRFIGLTQDRTLRIELRIVLVGERQRAQQRIRERNSRRQTPSDADDDRDGDR